jgi:hypothetical protein
MNSKIPNLIAAEILHMEEHTTKDYRIDLGRLYIDSEMLDTRSNVKPLPGPNFIDRSHSAIKILSRKRHK